MHFEDVEEGDYRIYAGALESRDKGYVATLVVTRTRGADGKPAEAYRDDDMAFGYVWDCPSRALSYALNRGRTVIHHERHRLSC